MLLRLETNQIVRAEIGDQLARDRQGFHHRWRRKRNVQEKAHRAMEAALAQHAAERDQMIVVRPHRVVRLQHGAEGIGEAAIDRQVALVILAAEAHQADPEMQQRPQRAVGEADIEAAIVLRGEVDRGVGHTARLDQRRLRRRFRGETSAPAEPYGAWLQKVA
jgi:hypothetical protein